MANIQINIIENGKTTLATSGCICDRNIDINVDVPTTGGGSEDCNGLHIPNEALVISGECEYRFNKGKWDWFINNYGNQITTNNITNAKGMFSSSQVSEIPFEINISSNCYYLSEMFSTAREIKYLPKINLPETKKWQTVAYSNCEKMFANCDKLRKIPEDLLKELYASNNIFYNQMFYYCYALDELKNLPVGNSDVALVNNKFSLTFNGCSRLKDIMFATDNGTPYTAQWKSQTIDLTSNIGYGMSKGGTSTVTENQQGFPNSKYVSDDASYQALKNDPDWFTDKIAYSRYNHDSALRTIQSLPDCSAYIATAGGTNTIKFKGESGSATDGGAINTLTAEEIKIATDKGWTVQIV